MLSLLLLFPCFLSACDPLPTWFAAGQEEIARINPLAWFAPVPGEIARINGRSITVAQLEAAQESATMYWGLRSRPGSDDPRHLYGPSLYELMAVELVKEQLEKKNLAVTDAELAAEESLIRADYDEGAFGDMLVTNAISLENWRFLLRNSLSVRKFQQDILRPDVIVSPAEVEEYFAAHQQNFFMVAKEHYILITGFEEEAVRRASDQLMKSADDVQVQADNPDVQVQTVRIPRNRLMPQVREELAKILPGQMSPILAVNGEFRSMLLLAATPEHMLSASESYPLIEAILMEEKLNAAYNAWVRENFAKAEVMVAPQFLRGVE